MDNTIDVGDLLVVKGAIRDEGFSYHYLKPSRIVKSDRVVRQKIIQYLKSHHLPYREALCWTTDALFRETKARIAARKKEGASIVEMEQAGCLAVAKFRKIACGAILYGGDDVSGETWDQRGWKSRMSIRYQLIEVCKTIVEGL